MKSTRFPFRMVAQGEQAGIGNHHGHHHPAIGPARKNPHGAGNPHGQGGTHAIDQAGPPVEMKAETIRMADAPGRIFGKGNRPAGTQDDHSGETDAQLVEQLGQPIMRHQQCQVGRVQTGGDALSQREEAMVQSGQARSFGARLGDVQGRVDLR